ncbi:sensor histidine kinase [Blautia schinkii]|nr:sensor histidine kinase [Blautia schinkii]
MRQLYKSIFQSIKNRILLIFFGCVVIPSIIFIGIFIHSYSNYILESTISEQRNVLREINKSINQYFTGYKDTSMNIYYNSSIISYLNGADYQTKSDYIGTFLSGIVNSEKYIAAAVMQVGDNMYQAGYQYLELEDWLEKARPEILSRKGRVVWFPTEQFKCSYGQKPYQFVMARAVNSPEETIGVLLFFVSADLFGDCFNNPAFQKKDTVFYLISDDGQVVAGSKEESVASTIDTPLFRQVLDTGEGNFVYEDKESREKSIVVCEKSDVSGWTLMTVTGEKEAYSQLHTIWRMAGIIGCLYMGFMLLAYYILSVYVFRPVKRLGKGMKSVSAGEFRHIEEEKEGKGQDEISHVIHRYNEMVDQIGRLMEEIRREEEAKNTERLKVLSMQISPHFVYNTLNTIKWMAAANRQENICRMIESLIKMMVSVTYHTNEEVTVREELELLECYVYIQKMRFMNFEVEIEVPEELLDLKVNKLVLQPFVENCILYAFKDKEELGIIRIGAEKTQNALEIRVEDNGCGFEPDKIKPSSIDNSRNDHVGIGNVSERIRLNYGEDYGVHIESSLGAGTTVYIRLPLLK